MAYVVMLRLVKFVGVLAFAMGVAISVAPNSNDRVRQRATYAVATPGFLLTWIAGWGMAKLYSIPLGAPWITISMAASLVVLHEVIREVEPTQTRSLGRSIVIVLALLVSLTSMVVRHV